MFNVYDIRDRSRKTAPSPSLYYSFTHTHRSIGYLTPPSVWEDSISWNFNSSSFITPTSSTFLPGLSSGPPFIRYHKHISHNDTHIQVLSLALALSFNYHKQPVPLPSRGVLLTTVVKSWEHTRQDCTVVTRCSSLQSPTQPSVCETSKSLSFSF